MTPLSYDIQLVDIPREVRREVVCLLTDMGLSLRTWPDGSVTVLIRHGWQGARDRLAVMHAEIRFSRNRLERHQWLEMCWRLPSDYNPQIKN